VFIVIFFAWFIKRLHLAKLIDFDSTVVMNIIQTSTVVCDLGVNFVVSLHDKSQHI